MTPLRFACAALISLLPSWLKVPLYRVLFGYRIGRKVKIGFGTIFVGVERCAIADHARIGPGNLFFRVQEVQIGEHARVGYLNLFRGGQRIRIGAYATLLRWNVFNSIINADVLGTPDPVLDIGDAAVITTGHWFDFTDRITLGPHSIIGGRNSSFWTHNRQRTRPIHMGPHCYVGSEVRVAPGVETPPMCIIALGSVLMGVYDVPRSLICGNPARIRRPLTDGDLFLVTHKTRSDLPEEMSGEFLPAASVRHAAAPAEPVHREDSMFAQIGD